jgi:hypothetical protein
MSGSSQEPNKQQLYGEFQRTERWRDRLSKKLAHKSLDIAADDEMVINQQHSGLGWKELGMLAAALLGGGWLTGLLRAPASSTSPATPPAATSPALGAGLPTQPQPSLEPIHGRIRFWVEDQPDSASTLETP